jgi:hypothetical protein
MKSGRDRAATTASPCPIVKRRASVNQPNLV